MDGQVVEQIISLILFLWRTLILSVAYNLPKYQRNKLSFSISLSFFLSLTYTLHTTRCPQFSPFSMQDPLFLYCKQQHYCFLSFFLLSFHDFIITNSSFLLFIFEQLNMGNQSSPNFQMQIVYLVVGHMVRECISHPIFKIDFSAKYYLLHHFFTIMIYISNWPLKNVGIVLWGINLCISGRKQQLRPMLLKIQLYTLFLFPNLHICCSLNSIAKQPPPFPLLVHKSLTFLYYYFIF